MRIGVDIDGTLSLTFERYAEEFNAMGHDVRFEDFHYDNGFPGLPSSALWAWYWDRRDELRRSYDRYPGSPAVVNLLQEHDIVFLTSRSQDEPVCSATLDWLKTHRMLAGPLVHASDKLPVAEKLGIDLMIEDAPANALGFASIGVPVLLFDQPYNRHVSHPLVRRFSHWIEVPRLVRGEFERGGKGRVR